MRRRRRTMSRPPFFCVIAMYITACTLLHSHAAVRVAAASVNQTRKPPIHIAGSCTSLTGGPHARTQADATLWGTPRVESFSLEGALAGVDVMPLLGSQAVDAGGGPLTDRMAGGQAVRAKLSGKVQVSAQRNEAAEARKRHGLVPAGAGGGYLFTGEVGVMRAGAGWAAWQLAGSGKQAGACSTAAMPWDCFLLADLNWGICGAQGSAPCSAGLRGRAGCSCG